MGKVFLEGIIVSGKSAIETADKLIFLREKNVKLINSQNYTKELLRQ